MNDKKLLLSSSEVCRYCGFSTSVLKLLKEEGKLKPVNEKGLYDIRDIDIYLEKISTKI